MFLRRTVAVSKQPEIHKLADSVTDQLYVADHPKEALEIVDTAQPELVILDSDISRTGKKTFLINLRENHNVPVVIANAADDDYTDTDVYDVLEQNNEAEHLKDIARKIKAENQAKDIEPNNDFYLDEQAKQLGFVGKSKASTEALKKIRIIAESNCNPILITGQTGTGKEVAANAIHKLRTPGKPFVALNCAALTANLLESELFGHIKGAFTGASSEKKGLIEAAKDGTIFLDEISEMPSEMQAKLLRVIQEKSYRKVGGTQNLKCNATIIASSNRRLEKAIEKGDFRKDLYYRLNIFPVNLKNLSNPDRKEEIKLLAEYFIQNSDICPNKKRKIKGMTRMAEEALTEYDWPGNVRELKNVIERAIMLENTEKIGLSSLIIHKDEHHEEPKKNTQHHPAKDFSLEKAERELIARALQETGWQKTRAAALLGITRATLYTKVKQYNLKKQSPAGSGDSCCEKQKEKISA